MAKEILEVSDFAGGLNNNTDPRDIRYNELAKIEDMQINRVGRIERLGDQATHAADSGLEDASEPAEGYGLIHIPHDRRYLQIGGQHLKFSQHRDYSTGSYWTSTTTNATVAFSTTNARITSGANNGVAKIAQVHGSRKHLGVANQDYMLEYEILLNTDNHCIRIELINSRTDTSVQTDDFFAVIPTLATNIGVHRIVVRSNTNQSNLNTASFAIRVTFAADASTHGDIKFGRLTLKPFDTPNTGDNYFIFGENGIKQRQHIYSLQDTGWNFGPPDEFAAFPDIVANNDFAYYYANGYLRYCNANFNEGGSASNVPKILGYADNKLRTGTMSKGRSQHSSWETFPGGIPKPAVSWAFREGYPNEQEVGLSSSQYSPVYEWNESEGATPSVTVGIPETTLNNFWSVGDLASIRVRLVLNTSDNEAGDVTNILPGDDWPLNDLAHGGFITLKIGKDSHSMASGDMTDFDEGDWQLFRAPALDWDTYHHSCVENEGIEFDIPLNNLNDWELGASNFTTLVVHILESDVPATSGAGTVAWKINNVTVYRQSSQYYDVDNALAPLDSTGFPDRYGVPRLLMSTSWFDLDSEVGIEASGWIDSPRWYMAASIVYDGNQEGMLSKAKKVITDTSTDPNSLNIPSSEVAFFDTTVFDEEQAPQFEFEWLPHEAGINKRFTGWNIYFRAGTTSSDLLQIFNNDEDVASDWFLAFKIDIRKGTLHSMMSGSSSGIETAYLRDGSQSGKTYRSAKAVLSQCPFPPNLISYFDHSFIPEDEISITPSFKTATKVGNRIWLGNLKYTTEQTAEGSNIISRPDGMVGCIPGKYDIFPLSYVDEIETRDGDSITKLESYADRILQFKRNKMVLLNVESFGEEFVEDTFMYKGIDYPQNSCLTDYGVAWCNKHGVYLYNGEDVVDLFEFKDEDDNITRKISPTDWESHVKTGGNYTLQDCNIGYLPIARQILVTGGTNGGYAYIYDIATRSWTYSTDITANTVGRTNLVNDKTGDLVWLNKATGGNNTFKKWAYTSTGSASVDIETKEWDFGKPGVKKKVYKVYITYKGDADSITTSFRVKGGTTDYNFNSDTTPLADVSGVWTTVELKPTTSSEANNIYSFQLKLDGSAGADFAINDISIVYRFKRVK